MQSQETITLDHKDFNERTRRWSVGLLAYPGTKLISLHRDEATIPASEWRQEGRHIVLAQGVPADGRSRHWAVVAINPRGARLRVNATIVVAVIGLLGTIFQLVYPDLRDDLLGRAPSEPGGLFDFRYYAISDTKPVFELNLIHNESPRLFTKAQVAESNMWIAIRKNTDVDPITSPLEHLHGPIRFSSGTRMEIPIPQDLYDWAEKTCEFLEAAIFLADVQMPMPALPVRPSDLKAYNMTFVDRYAVNGESC